ncbi:hypothetical protein IAR55_004522 [Kwoniella newhampshirensis]|uniref:Uncharacterized protein n=1 Tax=Kwoniella newhampshirensis TaxID=1651941 RepID=A0AAW0YNN4_9TREE
MLSLPSSLSPNQQPPSSPIDPPLPFPSKCSKSWTQVPTIRGEEDDQIELIDCTQPTVRQYTQHLPSPPQTPGSTANPKPSFFDLLETYRATTSPLITPISLKIPSETLIMRTVEPFPIRSETLEMALVEPVLREEIAILRKERREKRRKIEERKEIERRKITRAESRRTSLEKLKDGRVTIVDLTDIVVMEEATGAVEDVVMDGSMKRKMDMRVRQVGNVIVSIEVEDGGRDEGVNAEIISEGVDHDFGHVAGFDTAPANLENEVEKGEAASDPANDGVNDGVDEGTLMTSICMREASVTTTDIECLFSDDEDDELDNGRDDAIIDEGTGVSHNCGNGGIS